MNAAATATRGKRKERDLHSPTGGNTHLAGEKRAGKRRNRQDENQPQARCLASNKYLDLSVTSAHLLQEEYRQGATLAVHELHYLKGNNKEKKKEELLEHLDSNSDGPAPAYKLGAQLELLGSNGCPLVCAKCWPKYGPSLVKINHRGGPLIATPLNFNVKIKVMCCSFHHHDQPLQVRLWIESGHHLLEGTIALGVVVTNRETKRALVPLAMGPLPNSVHLHPTINLDDLDPTFLPVNERTNDHDLLDHQPCQPETDDAPPLPQPSDAASHHQDSSANCSLSPNEIEHLLEVLFGHGVELAQAREEINRLPY